MKFQLDMTEINKIEWNGLNAISLFSGCGGSSLGYKLAGFRILLANEFDKEAQEVYELNHPKTHLLKDDIRNVTGKQILKLIGLKKGELDVFDGSPPCFEKGTFVYTSSGFKVIEDVKIGDFVLTHTNEFKKVYDVMSKTTDRYINLRIQGSDVIKVTYEHPFYVRTMKRVNGGFRKFSDPFWKNASELSTLRYVNKLGIKQQDYVGIAINQKSELPEWNGVDHDHFTKGHKLKSNKNTIDFDSESFWYLVGRYIGDGWLRHQENDINNPKQKARYTVFICTGKHERDEFEKQIKKTQFNYCVSESSTTFKFSISSKELVHYLLQFGRGAKNKRLTSDILNLPIHLMKPFLDGYLDADGNFNKKRNVWSCCSISKELIVGIQHCVHKVYKVPTNFTFRNTEGKSIIEGRTVNTNNSYSLRFRKETKKQQHGFYEDNYIWVPFREKLKVKDTLQVFNLSVEKDESYTVNNLICHNCSAFSTMGKREKGWGEDKKYSGQIQVVDDLFFEYARILKELMPKVFVAENVKGMTIGQAKHLLGDNQNTFFPEKNIIHILRSCGYRVEFKVLNASQYGVPQTRERLIIIGIRNDLEITPTFPKKINKLITTEDAIGDLINDGTDFKNSPKKTMFIKEYFRPGCTLREAAIIAKKHKLTGVMMYYTRRDRWKKPFQTILQSGDRAFHPRKDRSLSIHECKRLCSFPDDFILPHSPKENWERLGRAVPPNLMKNVALHISKILREHNDGKERTSENTGKRKKRNRSKRTG